MDVGVRDDFCLVDFLHGGAKVVRVWVSTHWTCLDIREWWGMVSLHPRTLMSERPGLPAVGASDRRQI